jgi:hypothetical protein
VLVSVLQIVCTRTEFLGVLPAIVLEKKCQLNTRLLNRRFVGLSSAECLVLLIFTAIAAVTVWFHEPWADEAQAWLIARDLGIRGILNQMGYEGSPPLWHLLLWGLIRLHLPYAALGAVSLALVAAGMYIWLRWSPLPAPVRLLVPFAFYYQYQYAVVARSYALSTFLAFAAVALWRSKPVHVIPFGLVVALLAQTNMYGFMIAGGIACAFALECFRDFRKQRPLRTQIFQTSVAGLFVLVSAAVARSLAKPFPDCSFRAAIQFQKGTALGSIARGLGGLPELSTALGLNITWGLSLLLIFTMWAIASKKGTFLLPSIATLVLIYQMSTGKFTFFGIGASVVLLILVLCWFFAVKQLACALPLIFTVLAMGLVWSRPWHYGMALTAFLVSVWGAWPAGHLPEFESPTRILAVSLAVLLVFQLPSTAETVRAEVQGPYSGGKATAEFLRPYVGSRPIYSVNFYGTGVQPYYDRNIFVNWPTAFWTWSTGRASESNQILYESPPNNAIIVVPSGGQAASKLATSKLARVQLAKRHFLRRHEFCGAQFWLGRVSEYECYEIYERQPR